MFWQTHLTFYFHYHLKVATAWYLETAERKTHSYLHQLIHGPTNSTTKRGEPQLSITIKLGKKKFVVSTLPLRL